ncbi:potassium/proton antiporter [Thiohalocapsa halophila]|jgi:cell volume regulation protein A
MVASLDLSVELAVLLAAAVVLASVLISPLATRLGAPILLLFLGVGMLLGQDGPGGFAFDDFELVYDIGSIALAVILFAGGLGTRLTDIRVCWGPALLLATVGVVITAGVVGLAVWAAGMALAVALLLGAVIGSTDAAATFLLLQGRGIRLRGRVMETIVVESGLNDPMAIFLTLTLVTIVDAGGGIDTLSWALAGSFAQQIGIGAAAGLLGGLLLGWIVQRLELAQGLYGVLALAAALALFEGTQLVGGSGYLAVYLCGVLTMHRLDGRRRDELDITHGSLAWLSQIVMFLLLGILVTPSELAAEALAAAGVAAVLIFVARPVAVGLCLLPFRYTLKERLFIAWVGLRGAVPIFLAIIPVLSPGPVATDFFNIVFLVVIASLVLQGWTIPWLARRLDLEAPPDQAAGTPADADPLRP